MHASYCAYLWKSQWDSILSLNTNAWVVGHGNNFMPEAYTNLLSQYLQHGQLAAFNQSILTSFDF